MPGRCPSCNQVYTDEALSFCPNDGTPLAKEQPSSYDPQATLLNVPPPQTNPPAPPQGYYQPGDQAPPPPPYGQQAYGQQDPYGGQQQPPPYGQQAPPYGQQQPPYGQQQYAPQYGAAGAKSSKLPLIIGLLAVLLIGGGIGLYFLLRGNSSSSDTASTTNDRSSTTTTTGTTNNSTRTSTLPTPSTTTSTTTTTTTGGDYTEDEKHKLFQAAGITRDNALILEVTRKMGLVDSAGQPTDDFQPFLKEHINWAMKNAAWVQEHRDPDKAREYVMANK